MNWWTNFVKEFKNQILASKTIVSLMRKKNLVKALSYIDTRSSHIIKNKLPYCNLWFVFQVKCKISNFFTFKDEIPSFLRSGIVFKCQCGGRNATYYGKTKRRFKFRMSEQVRTLFPKELITCLILKIFQLSLPTKMTLKLS